MANKLTYERIVKITTPRRFFDGGTGLRLLIKSPSKKYRLFRFKFNGNRQDMELGVSPAMPWPWPTKRYVKQGGCCVVALIHWKNDC